MKDLFIYHQGTGTLISLRDAVYLVDADIAGEQVMDAMENGETVGVLEHGGYRLDNYNMTNLFFTTD